MVDPQVKETSSLAQIAARNRQTMPTEASHHIQVFNSCNPYTKESLATIQNGVWLKYYKTVFLSFSMVFEW